jgi:hypothetical protein
MKVLEGRFKWSFDNTIVIWGGFGVQSAPSGSSGSRNMLNAENYSIEVGYNGIMHILLLTAVKNSTKRGQSARG